jgi:hypothetical protein
MMFVVSNATPPSFRSAPLASLPVVEYRAEFGALMATALSKPGEAPEVWTVTRFAARARARVEQKTLAELRHGGFSRDCRALASVIRAGLSGRL